MIFVVDAPRLLTRIVSRRMIFVVDAATRRDREQPESETKTLGDLLYANKANFPVSENVWVRLVQAIAQGISLRCIRFTNRRTESFLH